MYFKTLAAAAATISIAFAATLPARAAVVYQAPANVLGGLCPTCSGTATTLGDDISLAGGPASLATLIWDTSNFGADYDADIKVELFNVDLSGSVPALGSLFHTQTTTHFLSGGNGSSSRTFVEIDLGNVAAPERFIYAIEVLNNNGSTNWNVAGHFADNAADEDETQAQAQVGSNNEFDFFFGDWVPQFGADTGTLSLQRLSMDSYQLGLPANQAFADFSNMTPNVTFLSAEDVPAPATLPLLAAGLAGIALRVRGRRPRA